MNKWLLIPIILLVCDTHEVSAENQYPYSLVHINKYTDVMHDQSNHSTCWIYSTTGYNSSISCLPDKSFAP